MHWDVFMLVRTVASTLALLCPIDGSSGYHLGVG